MGHSNQKYFLAGFFFLLLEVAIAVWLLAFVSLKYWGIARDLLREDARHLTFWGRGDERCRWGLEYQEDHDQLARILCAVMFCMWLALSIIGVAFDLHVGPVLIAVGSLSTAVLLVVVRLPTVDEDSTVQNA